MGAPEVFFSYNRDDHAVAQRFATALQAQGLGVWWDTTLRAAESSVTLEDLQAGNLAIFYAPEDAAEMNAVLERLWPDAEPDAPTV